MSRKPVFIATIAICIVSYGGKTNALQKFSFNEGERIEGVISKTELNRLRIEGDRIKEIIGLSKDYHAEGEGKNGQIFIKASTETNEPAIFSIITEKGKTQDFKLLPKSKKGEVIIVETIKTTGNSNTVGVKHKNHGEILDAIKQAFHEPRPREAIEEKESAGIRASLLVMKQFHGYLVEVWNIMNISQDSIEINEKDFEFQGKLAAIALEKLSLNPEESTIMYVVRP